MTEGSASDTVNTVFPRSDAEESLFPERRRNGPVITRDYRISTSAVDVRMEKTPRQLARAFDWLQPEHYLPSRDWIPSYGDSPNGVVPATWAIMTPDLLRYYLTASADSGFSQRLTKEYTQAEESIPFIVHKITLSELKSIEELTSMKTSPKSRSFSFDDSD